MAVPANVAAFLDLVVKSGILEKDVLDPYLHQMRAVGTMPEEPAKLGAVLVRDGLLTQFQVNQFLQGKWRGFFISGKYKLLEQIGTGGMGSVFLCEHKAMRRRVAIKVLPPDQARDPSALERFYREARAVAALDHPNIVRAHDIDHDGKNHFLVLEYVDGSSLYEIVQRCGPMDVTRAAHYIRQAALGLHQAHLGGLVHRDIKPANLLLDRQGVVKILDMGLARFFHDKDDMLTKQQDEKAILGTADYLAPEQAMNSHEVDVRADIYSLGATFYYLLAGRPPFAEGTVAQKLVWHQLRNPTPLKALRADTPSALAAIINRMMAKDTAERYQTPAEVYEALAPWTQTPIPPPPDEEMPKSGVRTRTGSPSPTNKSRVNSAPWLSQPAPVFPSAESTSVQLPPPAPPTRATSAPIAQFLRRKPVLWTAAGILAASLLVTICWAMFRPTPKSPPGPDTVASSPTFSTPPAPVYAPSAQGPVYGPGIQSYVCIMLAEDRREHVLFTSPDRCDCPIWTPDGQALLWSSRGRLFRLPVLGSRPDRHPDPFPTGSLNPSRDYCFSRDGNRLALLANDAIYLLPAAGGEPAPLEPRLSGYVHGWSPDGKNLVYCAARNGPLSIYRRPIDGGEETLLTDYQGYNDAPEYSPDGKWIYFSSDRSGKKAIWRIPATAASPNDERAKRITMDESEDHWFPHPSPDGKWLLFLSGPKGHQGVPDKVEVHFRLLPMLGDEPAAGPVPETAWFIGGQGTSNAPCWSPDSKRFAYIRYAPR
jgi:serine/threonine protein kinase